MIHRRCAGIRNVIRNKGLTYMQEFKLKQLLICCFKSLSKKNVALLQEGHDIREGKMGECGRSILVASIAAKKKHE